MRHTVTYRFAWIGALSIAALLLAARPSHAQPMDPGAEVMYTVERNATLYHASDSTRPYLRLRFREPVVVVDDTTGVPGTRWKRVRTADGANGLVRSEHVSNVWIRVSKSEQTLYVYRGAQLLAKAPTDLGYNFFSDKERRGSNAEPDHWRTPEGEFYVVSKNARSQFYKALVINYPNAEDARRGHDQGLINDEQLERIVNADENYEMPPMNTPLGGWIEIHGDGTGQRKNWTQGCIAIENFRLDQIWNLVKVGTPVLIES